MRKHLGRPTQAGKQSKMKNVTFGDIRDLETEYECMRAGASPEVDAELRADFAKAKNLVKYRYAALALFIGLIAFIAIAS